MSEPVLIDVRDVLPRDYRLIWRRALWEEHGQACGICNLPVDVDKFDVDHIVQRCLGGTDTWDNLRPAHRRCNMKRERGSAEWRSRATVTPYRSLYH